MHQCHHGCDSLIDFDILLLKTTFVRLNEIEPLCLVHVLLEQLEPLIQRPSHPDHCFLEFVLLFVQKLRFTEDFSNLIDGIFN